MKIWLLLPTYLLLLHTYENQLCRLLAILYRCFRYFAYAYQLFFLGKLARVVLASLTQTHMCFYFLACCSLTNRPMKMKEQLSSKQQERNEKKKKKLAALANIIQMNDRDRIQAAEERKSELEDEDDDGFVTVCSKRKPRNRLTIMAESSSETRVTADDAGETGSGSRSGSGSGSGCDEPEIKRSRNHSAGGDNTIDNVNLTLSEDQYKSLSTELRRRKRELESIPAVNLRDMGRRAHLEIPQDERTPIFLTDIQHLLMSALIGKKSPCVPDRWCSAEKFQSLSHSVVLILEGLSLYHYLSHESLFQATNRIFETKLEMVMPPQDEGNIIDTIAQVSWGNT